MMDDENNRLCSREERMMSHTVSIVYSTKGRRDSLPLEMIVRLCYRSTNARFLSTSKKRIVKTVEKPPSKKMIGFKARA